MLTGISGGAGRARSGAFYIPKVPYEKNFLKTALILAYFLKRSIAQQADNLALQTGCGNAINLLYFRLCIKIVLSILQVGFAVRRAVATLAYEWHTQEWTVRASADSDGLVGATLQKAIGGKKAQLGCAISALLNHPNDKFRLGFAVTAAII